MVYYHILKLKFLSFLEPFYIISDELLGSIFFFFGPTLRHELYVIMVEMCNHKYINIFSWGPNDRFILGNDFTLCTPLYYFWSERQGESSCV